MVTWRSPLKDVTSKVFTAVGPFMGIAGGGSLERVPWWCLLEGLHWRLSPGGGPLEVFPFGVPWMGPWRGSPGTGPLEHVP